MDTTQLKVNDYIRIKVRDYCYEGIISKVTPEGMEVQTDYSGQLHFDKNGRGRDRYGDPVECAPIMDATKLVVGQEVSMSSGIYGCKGKVVEVTPEGVVVQDDYSGGLIRFDKKGKGLDRLLDGTYEAGEYYIDDFSK